MDISVSENMLEFMKWKSISCIEYRSTTVLCNFMAAGQFQFNKAFTKSKLEIHWKVTNSMNNK